MSAETVVRLRGAGRRFGPYLALAPLDLTVCAGERVAVLGSSGAGKSIQLGMLNGTVVATEGTVHIFGEDVATLPDRALRRVQRRVGTVSQRLDLVEQVRVLHNVNAGRLGSWSTPWALVSVSMVWPRPDDLVRDALDQGINTSTAVGRIFFEILGSIGEHTLMSVRTIDGLVARRRGRTGGRKPKLGARQIAVARQMYDEVDANGRNRFTVDQIAAEFGVTRPTIHRYLDVTS